MTGKFILNKDHLTPFLRRLKKDCRLVAPVRNRHGDTLFNVVEDIDATHIDLENQAQASLKSFLFPQQEILFSYSSSKPEEYVFQPQGGFDGPTVYFGMRSCDLSGILYMDVVFSRNSRDPYYFLKRENAILVSIGCNTPFPNCFCNATRSGPFLEYGFDLQLTDLGDRFFVEIGRAKGGNIVNTWRQFFQPAGEEDTKRQYQAFLEARGLFKQYVHVDQAVKRLKNEQIPDQVWQELSLRCQDCSGCAFICPTCVCFTISDRKLSADRGERVRSWDACTCSGFTRMAGGHNPVDQRTAAVKTRFLHKLLHDVEKHGRPSCVGCGRCVGMCFGGVDMIRFINRIHE